MRQILVGVLLLSAVMPVVAFAQVPTCEQRLAVLGQLADDLSVSRRNVEIDAATLKVQVRALMAEIEASKKKVETPKAP